MSEITIKISVPAQIIEDGDVFVSICPVLDLVSQGCTKEEAKANLIEAIQLFIETCIEMGTLSTVMKQCGFSRSEHAPATIACADDLDVFLPFIAAQQLRECRA
jgi:predicted RNase H-like HicB family nuclease